MNILHDISKERIAPSDFVAVVEIEKNSSVKYEIDKETGMLLMDRALHTSTHYPTNYGFIPLTHADDNDPLDVFVYCSKAILPMTLVRCYPIGSIDMVDGGEVDTKIIAVPYGDPTYNHFKDINEMPPHIINELLHFLKVYKDLEGNKKTEIGAFHNAESAQKEVSRCMDNYKKKYNK